MNKKILAIVREAARASKGKQEAGRQLAGHTDILQGALNELGEQAANEFTEIAQGQSIRFKMDDGVFVNAIAQEMTVDEAFCVNLHLAYSRHLGMTGLPRAIVIAHINHNGEFIRRGTFPVIVKPK
jgi:hypothetical protein